MRQLNPDDNQPGRDDNQPEDDAAADTGADAAADTGADAADGWRREGSSRARHRKSLLTARGPNAALATLLVGGVTVCGGVAAAGYLGTGGWQTPTGEAAAANVGTVSSTEQPAAAGTGPAGTGPGSTAQPTAPGSSSGPTGNGVSPTPTGSTPAPSTSPSSSPSPSGSPTPTGTGAGPSPSASPSPTSGSPSATPSASATSATPTPTPTTSSASPTPTPTPTQTPVNSEACTNPVFTTSALYGTYTALPYYVANNMWNVGTASASETLSACSASAWNVDATISGGGSGVKTYPNSHINFANTAISSLSSVTSTFSDSGPDSGTYEDAYDIWLNGIADPAAGSDELMIWTSNHGQTPGGSPMATVDLDGMSWTAWKGNGGYMAFVNNSGVASGTLNLLAFFQWVIAEGWVPANSTLSQVGYGVEIVSTNGAPATFSFSNFGVSAS